MFINISNHPSSKWGEKQLEAAKGYGKIIDIPFPSVDPEATTQEVLEMAYGILTAIEEAERHYKEQCDMVHLVGEPTLTTAAVSVLMYHRYRVCTSTTRRISVENPDGTITKGFEFCRLREYVTVYDYLHNEHAL